MFRILMQHIIYHKNKSISSQICSRKQPRHLTHNTTKFKQSFLSMQQQSAKKQQAHKQIAEIIYLASCNQIHMIT